MEEMNAGEVDRGPPHGARYGAARAGPLVSATPCKAAILTPVRAYRLDDTQASCLATTRGCGFVVPARSRTDMRRLNY